MMPFQPPDRNHSGNPSLPEGPQQMASTQGQLNTVRAMAFMRGQDIMSRISGAAIDTIALSDGTQTPSAAPSTPLLYSFDATNVDIASGGSDMDQRDNMSPPLKPSYAVALKKKHVLSAPLKPVKIPTVPSVPQLANVVPQATSTKEDLAAHSPVSAASDKDDQLDYDVAYLMQVQTEAVLKMDTRQIVVDGVKTLLEAGPEACARDLVERAVEDYASALPVAMAAQAIRKEVAFKHAQKSKEILAQLRLLALAMFREYWKADGEWLKIAKATDIVENAYLTVRGVNIAGLLGSLFSVSAAVSADDLQLCMDLLANRGPQHFHKLCALHALIVQADDKLCKGKAGQFMRSLRDRLSGMIWTESSPGQVLIADTVGTIDGWLATQEMKQIHASQRAPSKTEKSLVRGKRATAAKEGNSSDDTPKKRKE